MKTQQILTKLARIQKRWEIAYAEKNWKMCQSFKAYYDTLWAGWDGK